MFFAAGNQKLGKDTDVIAVCFAEDACTTTRPVEGRLRLQPLKAERLPGKKARYSSVEKAEQCIRPCVVRLEVANSTQYGSARKLHK